MTDDVRQLEKSNKSLKEQIRNNLAPDSTPDLARNLAQDLEQDLTRAKFFKTCSKSDTNSRFNT